MPFVRCNTVINPDSDLNASASDVRARFMPFSAHSVGRAVASSVPLRVRKRSQQVYARDVRDFEGGRSTKRQNAHVRHGLSSLIVRAGPNSPSSQGMVRLDSQASANCDSTTGLNLWLDSPRCLTALMIMRSLSEPDARSIHSVHQVALRRVDASISQVGHHVNTSHPIWNHDVGDAEREVARLFRLDRGAFRQ